MAFRGQPGGPPRGRNRFPGENSPASPKNWGSSARDRPRGSCVIADSKGSDPNRKRAPDPVLSGGLSSCTQHPALFGPKALCAVLPPGWQTAWPITELPTSRARVFSFPPVFAPRGLQGRRKEASPTCDVTSDRTLVTLLIPSSWPGIWASPSTSQKEGPLCAASGSPPTPADTPAVYSTRADAADRDGEAVSPTGRYPWKSHDESHGAVAAVSPYGAAEWLLQDKNLSPTLHLRQAMAFNSRGEGVTPKLSTLVCPALAN